MTLSPRRILIIKPSAIGDVVHALPILELLHAHWPSAEIDWLVTPACAGLLEGHPLLSHVHLFQRRRLGSWWRNPTAIGELFSLTQALRDRRFDLVIDLQGLFRSGWLAWQTGAEVRVGLSDAREGAGLFYTHQADVGFSEQHALDRYRRALDLIGCPSAPVTFRFHTSALDAAHVDKLLGDVRPFAVLLPGTNWRTKRWPIEHFAAMVKPLREQFGLRCVTAGGPDDRALGDAAGADLNLAGQTSLKQLVALLDRAALVIANDSGPMHIAAALGKPMVTLFGPTNPVRTGPYQRGDTVLQLNIPCSPCYARKCAHQSCLKWLDSERVLNRVNTLFNASRDVENSAMD